MSAMTQQVDGEHYLEMLIQPLELSYLIAEGDASFCKLVKYITRNKGERKVNLEKAIHVVKLYSEISTKYLKNIKGKVNDSSYKLLELTFRHLRNPDLCEAICIQFLEGNLDECIDFIEQLEIEDSIHGS